MHGQQNVKSIKRICFRHTAVNILHKGDNKDNKSNTPELHKLPNNLGDRRCWRQNRHTQTVPHTEDPHKCIIVVR